MKSKTNDQRRDDALELDLRWMVPLAKRLARRAGRAGISVGNIRTAAENGSNMYAFQDRLYLSRLYSLVMVRAGLHQRKGMYVRTARIGKRGGNIVRLWTERAA